MKKMVRTPHGLQLHYTFDCLICGKSITTRNPLEPVCGDPCWRTLVARWKIGARIDGLGDRVNGCDAKRK